MLHRMILCPPHSNSTTPQFGSSPWLNPSTIPNPSLFSLPATGPSFTSSVKTRPKPHRCHRGRASGKCTWLARSQIITGVNSTEKLRTETIQPTVVSGTRETRKGWLQGHGFGKKGWISLQPQHTQRAALCVVSSPVQGWKSFPRQFLGCTTGGKHLECAFQQCMDYV